MFIFTYFVSGYLSRNLHRNEDLLKEVLHQTRELSISDGLTGLASRAHLLDALAQEIEIVGNCLRPGSSGCPDFTFPNYRAGLGVVLARVDSLARTQLGYGFLVGDRIMAELSKEVARLCPAQAIAARYHEDSFVLFLPEARTTACRKMAEALADAFAGKHFVHDLTDERIKAQVSFGLVNFPQDMDGALYERPAAEQARVLMRKAAKAAEAAREVGGARIMAFSQILEQGGRVVHMLPVNRLSVSLGRSVDAQEGQRFLVWSKETAPVRSEPEAEEYPALYKGEIALMEVREESALAEIMHLSDPTLVIESGDRLTLLRENLAPAEKVALDSGSSAPRKDPLTGLVPYRDFLAHWTLQAELCERFVLALLRLSPEPGVTTAPFHKHAEQVVGEAAAMGYEVFGHDPLGGRYSLNSIVFFHPGLTPEEGCELYREYSLRLKARLRIQAAAGLACHPYLAFRKADALENCGKALDYALLLPEPHVGLIDTLALNISADRLFSQGDLYGAMEEYKLALLADEDNNLARNSLGICLARLNRLPQARQLFEEVIRRDRRDRMALYNLGFACQRIGDIKAARAAYKRCLEAEPRHIYGLIRLGQLAEREGRLAQARKYYNSAARIEGGEGLTHRYLARLAVRQNRLEDAREHLHQALLHDPKDPFSLNLLAKLYLDSGEIPEIAEVLARQSVALRPDQKHFWIELSRAFEAGGKTTEAQGARAKAAVL